MDSHEARWIGARRSFNTHLTLWCKAAYVIVDVPCQIRSKMMSKCGNLLASNSVYGVSLNLRFRWSRRYADSERVPQVEMLKLQRKDAFNMITPFFYVDLFQMFRSCSFYLSWYVSTSLHNFYCQYSLPFTCCVNTNWGRVEVDFRKVALDQLNWMDMFCVKLGYSMMGNL